ncbi:TM1266 family iron-only hydrogenase system putative regulator [uncultured Ruminococcus sp.]|uniref:TM1266 family iron-only hydrogenase system putative regulator n=1 Tax=uncultured Ruminococcus sp. TaxID=165186 RepID=UPI0025F50695|nr:TM1266 family iron-only hydrogenase system putative regulator [uncultured Ruminococcus sp.]
METRVAVIAIIAQNTDSAESINALLHDYSAYIIGRMGVPYRSKGVNIISVAIDAPQDKINTLAGKIGRLDGVTAKTLYSAV